MVLSLTNNYGITEQEIMKVAPSVFAMEAHESRSPRFRAIPSIEIVRALHDIGFVPTSVGQSKPRVADRTNFTKHVVRLRHIDDLGRGDEGEVTELVYHNGADGSSAYVLRLGTFRFVCENGCVFGKTAAMVKVYHRGPQTVVSEVVEGTLALAQQAQSRMEQVQEMKSIALKPVERLQIAQQAHSLRFSHNSPFRPEDLLVPRRMQDSANDLWTTYNVVQENITRGGLRTRDERNRRHSTRTVTNVTNNLRLNVELFDIVEAMYLEKSHN